MAEFALVIPAFDYFIVDPTKRKFATYKEIGWDDQSITNYLRTKENHETIASFITNTVSFSASSRRNRFYEIYSRFFTSKSVLMETMSEMEEDKEIIEERLKDLGYL